ncbi:hypothetical protein D3C85_1563430 [compost metagenome]
MRRLTENGSALEYGTRLQFRNDHLDFRNKGVKACAVFTTAGLMSSGAVADPAKGSHWPAPALATPVQGARPFLRSAGPVRANRPC